MGLSTTLATNSILTGKGGQVGLICIGWNPDRDWDMGTKVIETVGGGHTVRGHESWPLDVAALDMAIDSMAHKVDAIAISSIFSVYNPDHEERARRAILDKVNMLTVTGHDLTTELGIKERTITAVLNAKLIPIIGDFLSSVEHSMEKRGIKGQIMVYKGDGSLMNIAVARGRPVDTILSGPAASLMGGRLLSKLENCIVLDIGGTSTDIAYLDRGFPRINREGASVGNWRTRVRAIDIWTSGLGGDSDMQVDRFGHLEIGPERVMPLAVASKLNPSLLDKLRLTRQTTYYMAYDRDASKLSHEDRLVYNLLRENQICTLNEANEALPELTFVTENLRSLKAKGFVVQTGVTPTDIMHVKGVYTPGDVQAAREGVEIFSNLSGMTVDQFTENFMDTMVTRIGGEVIKKIISDEAGDIVPSRALDYLMQGDPGRCGLQDDVDPGLPGPPHRRHRCPGARLRAGTGEAPEREGHHSSGPRRRQRRRGGVQQGLGVHQSPGLSQGLQVLGVLAVRRTGRFPSPGGGGGEGERDGFRARKGEGGGGGSEERGGNGRCGRKEVLARFGHIGPYDKLD